MRVYRPAVPVAAAVARHAADVVVAAVPAGEAAPPIDDDVNVAASEVEGVPATFAAAAAPPLGVRLAPQR